MKNIVVDRAAAALTLLVLAGSVVLPDAGLAAGSSVPAAYTGGNSHATYASVVLEGDVNPRGEDTDYHFEYGPTASYGADSPLGAAGSGSVSMNVSQAIGGLLPGMTYHYRLVASNAAGTNSGADRTFKTSTIPLSVQITGVPNPAVFGSPFFIEGTLSGSGAANREVVLQANPFPYLRGFKNLGNPEVATSAGAFSFPVVGLSENTQLRVRTVDKPTVTSPVVLESVAVRITLHARRTSRHAVYRLYGTVAPAEVGAQIGFQLLKPGHRSLNQGGTVVKPGTATVSQFSRRVRIGHPGVYRALIKVTDGAHVSSYSEPIVLR
jgi:hypothetical protein